MKRTLPITSLAAIALALAGSHPANAQESAAPASAGLPVGTCINMGNSLEPPQEGEWGGSNISQADFARIKAAGFDTVRIPVRWHNKSMNTPPYTVDPEWMARVVEVVDWALEADLNVILNSHHFDPIYDDPGAVSVWHGAVWTQIATRFADRREDKLWFELENEPHNNLDHSNLLETLAPALAAVRASNPTRPVIYGGENWSGIDSLATLPLPDDANVYPTFHYYDPFEFTHQGASWTAPNIPPPGRKFGNVADRQQLAGAVEKVRAYIARTGKVPFMGETGAYDLHVSTAERAEYHRAVTQAFAPTGIGICMWAYTNTYPFYDHKSGVWLAGMRDAIGLAEPGQVTTSSSAAVSEGDGPGQRPKGQRLPQGLESFEAQLPGWLLNDPTSLAWESYGPDLTSKAVLDETIPGGGAATRFQNTKAAEPWSAAANIPLIADVEKGRRVVIGFWARAVGSSAEIGNAAIGVRFQQNADPYPGFGDRMLSVGPEWTFYEVSATADRTIKRKTAIVALQLGGQEQTVEIGQAIVLVGASSISP